MATGVNILDDDEDENEIPDAMDQVDYDVHVYPDEEDDDDTGEDEEIHGHNDGYDNKDPEKIGEQPWPLLYIQYIYGSIL